MTFINSSDFFQDDVTIRSTFNHHLLSLSLWEITRIGRQDKLFFDTSLSDKSKQSIAQLVMVFQNTAHHYSHKISS